MHIDPVIQLTFDRRYHAWDTWSFLDQEFVEHVLTTTLKVSGHHSKHSISVEVLLVSDEEMSSYTHTYGPEPGPTNVLSFSMLDMNQCDQFPKDMPLPLGSIILGFEYISKEIQERALKPLDHLVRLLAHGMLHLLGHDHMTPEERNEMESCEQHICTTLNVRWSAL
jgi:probable rRNA maturation factor